MTVRLALALALALSHAPIAVAQGWGGFVKDKLKQQAQEKAGRAVSEAGDAAYQGSKEKAKGAPGREEDRPAAANDGAARGEPAPAAADRRVAGQGAPDEVAAGEVYGNRFDFVPGDRVLLFDDFVETDVGDYPARWTVKDGGGGNAVEVVSYKGTKWFKALASEDGINQSSVHYLRYDGKPDLPRKFTIEFDADMGGPFSVLFNDQHGFGGHEIRFGREEVQTAHVRAQVKPFGPVVKRVSIAVNGTYAKVYVGGVRVLQDPDAVERPIRRIGLRFDQLLGRGGGEDPALLEHQMITSFRLAEGGKDVAQALQTEGRIVVHGIYFATGSDVIRPESGGALRNILALLTADGALRFRVEGHTDDQGGPKVNGPLSERRAAAVKAWLVSQGVAASRLETKGLGATKPIGANDSQEGRANNRRVEFVKL